MNKLAVMLVLVSLVSACNSSSDSKKSSEKHSAVFNDSAVTWFTQISGLAKSNTQKTLDFIIPSVYAASGNIACIVGEDTEFSIQALGEGVTFSVPCSKKMDLSIRQELLEVLKGKTFLTQYDDGQVAVRQVNTTLSNSSDRIFTVATENAQVGKAGCFSNMTFNMDTGRVFMTENIAASTAGGCQISGFENDSYNVEMVFRFKDGAIEFDFNTSNPKFEVGDQDYVKWCLDQNSDGTCDTI